MRPLATTPHVPRSLVRPLCSVIQDLTRQIVHASQRGDDALAREGWLGFLALPRLVLHCRVGHKSDPDDPSFASALHQRLHEFQRGQWSALAAAAREAEPGA
eukprot:9622966-Karenia_brevis.AAC.1